MTAEAYREHRDMMTIVVQTLWLRRTGDSKFLGYPLVDLQPNYHYECRLTYPERYKDVLDQGFKGVIAAVRKTHSNQVKLYEQRKIVTMPVVKVKTWLMAARRPRIVSSFPELLFQEETKGLAFTLEELMTKQWLKNVPGKLYKLDRRGSPYEQLIHQIAGASNCPKMLAREKFLVLTMGPVSALIVYWVCIPDGLLLYIDDHLGTKALIGMQAIRLIWNKSVALIHSGLTKCRVAEIVKLFQEGKDGEKSSYTDDVPQMLVGSYGLLSVGYTCTAARFVTIFDPEWLRRNETQGIARVNRIGQDRETMSLKLVNDSSQLEDAMSDMKTTRPKMYKLVETLMALTDSGREALEEDMTADETIDDEGNLLDKEGRIIG